MNDRRIAQKVIKGLMRNGYTPDKFILDDIRKTISTELSVEKQKPYYILGLVCDYGFLIGVTTK